MKRIISFVALMLAIASYSLFGQELMVGAARVEITPDESELQKPTDTIRGRLFVRAIYITDGKSSAVLAGCDAGALHKMEKYVEESSVQTGCPVENYIFSGTHTHSGGTKGVDQGSPTRETIGLAFIEATNQAKANIKPARVGFGKTQLDLNANRDNYNKFQEWEQKPNWDAVCDKDLSVISFLGEDDVPIAIYMNYAMHPVNFNGSGVVSGDFPADASCLLEDYFDGSAVAIYAQGCAGDINPQLAYSQLFTAGPVKGVLPEPKPRNTSQAMGQWNRNQELTGKALEEYKQNVKRKDEYAHMLGTSIAFTTLKVMLYDMKYETEPTVSSGFEIVTCPGRKRIGNNGRENVVAEYEPADDLEIGVGLLSIGDIKLVSISAEAYCEIGMRLKRESPSTKTLVTTVAFFPEHEFESTGYIYSNNAAHHLTFQVLGSTLQPGYAEDGIVNAGLKLIRASK